MFVSGNTFNEMRVWKNAHVHGLALCQCNPTNACTSWLFFVGYGFSANVVPLHDHVKADLMKPRQIKVAELAVCSVSFVQLCRRFALALFVVRSWQSYYPFESDNYLHPPERSQENLFAHVALNFTQTTFECAVFNCITPRYISKASGFVDANLNSHPSISLWFISKIYSS